MAKRHAEEALESPTSKRSRLEDDEDLDKPVPSGPIRQDAPTEGYADLYLDTIDRSRLDFDFEKICSVSNVTINIYACLVCGTYFQGRGPKSNAYTHSLSEDHHVFINMETKKVYVLPDGYEVKDKSLDDIKYNVDPSFTKDQVYELEKKPNATWDLAGKKYIPGFVGLNNIKANDYFNVVIHALAHVPMIRNYFMLEDFSTRGGIARQFSSLVRKIWNPQAMKAHVSPHELLQAVSVQSKNRFNSTTQSDPVEFLTDFLQRLHSDVGGTKPGSSFIHRVFQGHMLIESQNIITRNVAGDRRRIEEDGEVEAKKQRFMILPLQLPPTPLFQDELDKNFIPQVTLNKLLGKFSQDGVLTKSDPFERKSMSTAPFTDKFNGRDAQEKGEKRVRYRLLHPLPPYIIMWVGRFSQNKYSTERNPTIVNFPLRSLDLNPYCQPNPDIHPQSEPILYDLVANITHEAVRGSKDEGVETDRERKKVWRVQVHERGNDEWYEVQDLFVDKVEGQTLFTKESYCMIWEKRRTPKGKGKGKQ
ncbi:MAG: hypothetical protein M1820_006514 [Bogoriella megaspora]|nr:MAG: hypothetical protein M1820_006514 [Bogoriella megaspora]